MHSDHRPGCFVGGMCRFINALLNLQRLERPLRLVVYDELATMIAPSVHLAPRAIKTWLIARIEGADALSARGSEQVREVQAALAGRRITMCCTFERDAERRFIRTCSVYLDGAEDSVEALETSRIVRVDDLPFEAQEALVIGGERKLSYFIL